MNVHFLFYFILFFAAVWLLALGNIFFAWYILI